MDLGFDTVERGDWTVLTITGEVDVATAPRLREKLVAMVNDGVYHVVVDLDQVEFLDSTGLGVLVGALKRIRGRKGELALVCTRARIRKGFEITGLTRVFPMFPSVEKATAVTVPGSAGSSGSTENAATPESGSVESTGSDE